MKNAILTTFLTLAALTICAHGAELLVPSQYSTIQLAIDAAVDGDTVIVAPGTYTGEGNWNIDFLGKAITVRSENGPNDCIIDCNDPIYYDDHVWFYPHCGFVFHGEEDTNSVLAGFTITNCYYFSAIGCYNSSPVISNCTITENSADFYGSIYCHYSSPTITNCNITGNSSDSGGGGINCCNGNPAITNCNITGNSEGGIYCYYYSSPTIIGCNITDNSAYSGGGIYCEYDSSPVITGCNIIDNSAYRGGGICCRRSSSPVITDCNVSGNSAGDEGGGIYCFDQSSSPVITDCNLNGNSAEYSGGGICGDYMGRITNCTIMGNSAGRYGGGLTDCNAPVTNCTITGNSAGRDGGGICCYYDNAEITGCKISGNSSGSNGGGIYCYNSGPVITGCTISVNSAAGDGGGIYCPSNTIITNCAVIGNSAFRVGGGIFSYGGNTIITNCVVIGNSAFLVGGGIYGGNNLTNSTIVGNSAGLDGGGLYTFGEVDLANCIFWANSDSSGQGESAQVCRPAYLYGYYLGIINYCCIQGWTGDWAGNGNIDADPCFIELGCWVDANDPDIIVEPNDPNAVWFDGDYHLLPTSPCINAGDPNYVPEPNETDLDGNPRINEGRIDMGAYESIMHEARLWISPQVLNRKSRQPKMIAAQIFLPPGITKDQVDEDTPLTLYPYGIEAVRQFVFQNRGRFDKRTRILAFFDREEFLEVVDTDGSVQLMALGCLLEPGQFFFGFDSVKILPPKPPPKWRW